ncbi:uncharacterized protein ACB058_021550 [Synchiropus picturatus]
MERRRKAPASLQLSRSQERAEPGAGPAASRAPLSPTRFKVKAASSPLIERLQANLALSPTALLPPPPPPLSPSSEEEGEGEDAAAAAGFSSPPGGAPLPSFNKTRARLSFKRRLPSRKHRRSSGEESPLEDGEQGAGFHSPEEEEEEEERDCEPSEKKLEETRQGLMEEEGGGEEEVREVREEEEKEEEEEEKVEPGVRSHPPLHRNLEPQLPDQWPTGSGTEPDGASHGPAAVLRHFRAGATEQEQMLKDGGGDQRLVEPERGSTHKYSPEKV